jgi:NAD+ synthase
MNRKEIINHITEWLRKYAEHSATNGFVVGISGGIDSAVTSTLCAMTGKRVIAINMPIRQAAVQVERSKAHITWLQERFKNVEAAETDLSSVLSAFEKVLPLEVQDQLAMANTRARIRMSILYAFAGHHHLLVAGTGNKIEDFGVGFFTKYGDGGVDLSPIADLTKTEVYALAAELGVVDTIQKAAPTDGLFGEERTDEDQIGASYPELEWAMEYIDSGSRNPLTARQEQVLQIYRQRNRANRHKMEPIPVCLIPQELKK